MNLLERFSFCPVCGSSHFDVVDFKSRRCSDCGYTYYMNAAAAVVAVVIDNEARLLVGKRAFEPARGTLDLPGGFVDPDESLDDALRREMLEETGMPIETVGYLFSIPNRYSFGGTEIPTTDCFMLCRPTNPDARPKAADDVAALEWIPLTQLKPELFGLVSIRKGIEKIMTLNHTQLGLQPKKDPKA